MARFVLRSHLRPWGRRWSFVLIADNNEPLLTSEPYNTKGAALDGIAIVRRLAPTADSDVREDHA